jgi:hypothetical protein
MMDLLCIRIAVDHVPTALPAGDLAPDVAALRQVAMALRELRPGWLAAGLELRSGVAAERVADVVDAWHRTGTPALGAGDAHVVTLVIVSHRPLITAAPIWEIENVRSVLEALSNIADADLVALELMVAPRPVPIERLRELHHPALVIEPRAA